MPTHLRTQIRSAVAGFVTSLSTTGARVYQGRTTPLAADASPSLLVDVGSESVEISSNTGGSGRIVQRELELVIRAAVKAVSGYLDTLDAIALEVETALAAHQSLGGLCKYVQLTAIDEPELDEGEKVVAVMAMHFTVLYYAALNAPQTAR